MNRTVRNGLAVATMAGGIWLLGQAVASADVTADSTATGDGTSVTQVEDPNLAGGGASAGAAAANTGGAQGGGGGNAGSAGSGATTQGTTGDVTYDGTGAPGGDASITVVSTGDTSSTGGSITTGDTTATSSSTGGSGAPGAPGGGEHEPDVSASSVSTGPSGGGTTAQTTVTAPNVATGGTSVGAAATNHGNAVGGAGGSTGNASSGDVCAPRYMTASLSEGPGGWPEDCSGYSGDVHYTGQGGAGGDAEISVSATGNTSSTGATITQGDVHASSDAEGVDGFLGWLGDFLHGQEGYGDLLDHSTWWWNGNSESGTLVVVPNTATGGSSTGTRANNSGNAVGGAGGSTGNAWSGDTDVTVFCFSFTKDNHCSLDAGSGTVTYHGVGGDGGAATIDVRALGATTSTGGHITTGSTSASSSAQGHGADAFTQVVGGNAAGGGVAIGTTAGNSGSAYGGNGGSTGNAWSGSVKVTLVCISWKGTNNCSASGHTGDVDYHGVGGKGGDAVITVVASGCTASTGGVINGVAAHIGDLCSTPAQPAQPAAPAQPVPPAAAPVQHVAPVSTGSGSHATTVNAAHSSPATLAYTGADVSDALGLGLLALAGGLGLALAGRRRTAA